MSILQKNLPARVKTLHAYNMGQFAEFMLGIMKMSLTEKMQKRLNLHGQILENVYKSVGMEVFPEEYLPDDYNGPSSGPVSKAIGEHIKIFKPSIVRF